MAWVFASGSTVLMAHPPSAVVWMGVAGSLAQPWEHYLPLKRDLSDTADQVDWCLRNHHVCQIIAGNARQLVMDAYYRPNPACFAERIAVLERAVLEQIVSHARLNPACDVARLADGSQHAAWSNLSVSTDAIGAKKHSLFPVRSRAAGIATLDAHSGPSARRECPGGGQEIH